MWWRVGVEGEGVLRSGVVGFVGWGGYGWGGSGRVFYKVNRCDKFCERIGWGCGGC